MLYTIVLMHHRNFQMSQPNTSIPSHNCRMCNFHFVGWIILSPSSTFRKYTNSTRISRLDYDWLAEDADGLIALHQVAPKAIVCQCDHLDMWLLSEWIAGATSQSGVLSSKRNVSSERDVGNGKGGLCNYCQKFHLRDPYGPAPLTECDASIPGRS